MDAFINNYITVYPTVIVLLIIFVTLYTLTKGAEILVDEAVSLSLHWGLPKIIIGVTIVSLGTTLPEVTVSVVSAINGYPDMALGNAVGSIIANTALIIGIAALSGCVPIDKVTINRQGRIQLLAAIFLVVVSLPFTGGRGNISQIMGFIFMSLLIFYIYMSIKWVKNPSNAERCQTQKQGSLLFQLFKLMIGVLIIIVSSKVLLPSVETVASRIGIPQGIIAATLVAFGTSLPEFATAITAVKKGCGELAIGNILGANILNVLFVIGLSASVTKNGLTVPMEFYKIQIPTMIIVLFVFHFFAIRGNEKGFSKKEGLILILIYIIYLVISYLII